MDYVGETVSDCSGTLFTQFQRLQAIPLTTFGLGCWQVQRKRWKERLIDELHVQTNSLPVDLPEE